MVKVGRHGVCEGCPDFEVFFDCFYVVEGELGGGRLLFAIDFYVDLGLLEDFDFEA